MSRGSHYEHVCESPRRWCMSCQRWVCNVHLRGYPDTTGNIVG